MCVPGTATPEFHAQFKRLYATPYYPNAKSTDAKFSLDKSKPDPLGLAEKKVMVKLPAGSVIFCSEWPYDQLLRS